MKTTLFFISVLLLIFCCISCTQEVNMETMIKSSKPLTKAIEAYFKKKGKYPAELKDLSPKYIKIKGFNYKGWYLYSVEAGTHPSSYSISHKIGRETSLSYDRTTNQWTFNSPKGKRLIATSTNPKP